MAATQETTQEPLRVRLDEDESTLEQPREIWTRALEVGEWRLRRRALTVAATALIGGVDVMLGVAAATVVAGSLSGVVPPVTAAAVGSLAFGIGFVFITIGRSELFSENLLIPVGAVLEKRATVGALMRMWGVSLVANLIGLFVLAAVLSVTTVLDHGAVVAAGHTADSFAGRTVAAAFLSAVVAGALMTLWTWLGTAARTDIGRIAIAYLVGFALAAPSLNHVVVGTGEMMFGVLGGHAHATWGDVGRNFGLALAGNVVGGVLFVTIARLIQARSEDAR